VLRSRWCQRGVKRCRLLPCPEAPYGADELARRGELVPYLVHARFSRLLKVLGAEAYGRTLVRLRRGFIEVRVKCTAPRRTGVRRSVYRVRQGPPGPSRWCLLVPFPDPSTESRKHRRDRWSASHKGDLTAELLGTPSRRSSQKTPSTHSGEYQQRTAGDPTATPRCRRRF
jgi:hypothetical protein